MNPYKFKGFTLIELMVVIAIVAVLSTLAAPSFKQMIQSNTISSSVNSLLADMRFARSEGMRRGGGIVVCHSDSPEASNPTCTTGSNWKSGWIVFHDLDNDGVKDATDPVLKVQGPLSSIDTVTETGNTSSKFIFSGTGRTVALSSAVGIKFGGDEYANERQRVVCVGISGRSRIGVDAHGKTNGSATC
ncbi:MAG: fimT [Comamonadaceae bacterium]|nr:MAG: fimT [Comamonadaceae bacterium]